MLLEAGASSIHSVVELWNENKMEIEGRILRLRFRYFIFYKFVNRILPHQLRYQKRD